MSRRDRSEHQRPELDHPGPPAPAEQREQPPVDGPRIYVASLTDYNAGILHGTWVAADLGVEVMTEAIDEMLAESPTRARYGDVAEEWRIDDVDGWGRHLHISEYESLQSIARLAEGLEEHGDAFGAWAELCGHDEPDELDRFAEAYLGEFTSVETYAEDLVEQMGIDIDELALALPESLRPYLQLDLTAWARDLELSGDVTTFESTGGVHVFTN